MLVNPETYRNSEGGPVAILGNGPSLNNWDLTKLNCDTIGINLSSDRIESEYWVTVALDRAEDVTNEKITAKKAVITNRNTDPTIKQNVIQVNMCLPDTYEQYAGKVNIFIYDLALPMHATFGGMLAAQSALFLGYNPIYLIGMDGGTEHFYPYRRDKIPPSYHRSCFWHLYDWWRKQKKIKIFQTNPDAIINWFPIKAPPLKGSVLDNKPTNKSKEAIVLDAALTLIDEWKGQPVSAKMISDHCGIGISTVNRWLQSNPEIFELTLGKSGQKFYKRREK